MFGLDFAQQQLACARPIVDLCPERWPLRVAPVWSGVKVSPWPGSPHLATGLHGGICIQIDSSGGMTAAAQNRFYTWPPEP